MSALVLAGLIFAGFVAFDVFVVLALVAAGLWYGRHPAQPICREAVPTVPPGRPRYRRHLCLAQSSPRAGETAGGVIHRSGASHEWQ